MNEKAVFEWNSQIRFHQADPAGWMFFGRAFELAHDCFEDFLQHLGLNWKDWFQNSRYAMPIRKAEADYRRPLPAGAEFQIRAHVSRLGETSVTLKFEFYRGADLCLVLQSTHVLMNIQTQKSEAWPPLFWDKLLPYAAEVAASKGKEEKP